MQKQPEIQLCAQDHKSQSGLQECICSRGLSVRASLGDCMLASCSVKPTLCKFSLPFTSQRLLEFTKLPFILTC